jgi:hypothetical protein
MQFAPQSRGGPGVVVVRGGPYRTLYVELEYWNKIGTIWCRDQECSASVWQTLLNAIALGGCPASGFFDGITDPLDRTLYVELEGRSIVRISGVPAPPVLSRPDFSLMDLAAILAEA